MKSLSGKAVVITGASSGIGRAAAIAFARRGSNVVLSARRVERLEEAKAEVEAMGVKALVVPTDVTNPEQVRRLVDASIEHFGQIDVLLNNAGFGLLGAFNETPIAEARDLFEVDFFAAVDVMQSVLQVMERQSWGVIINVSSVAGLLPSPYMPFYSASRSALIMLSETVNSEYLGTRIKIVAFCPAVTRTEFDQAARTVGRYTKWVRPVEPVPAELVAERIVKAALKPKPLITLGWYTLPSLAVKILIPRLYYLAIKRYRDAMQRANLAEDEV